MNQNCDSIPLRLKRNYPCLTELSMGPSEGSTRYIPRNDDECEDIGRSIGTNLHLKSLSIDFGEIHQLSQNNNAEDSFRNFFLRRLFPAPTTSAFFGGLGSNRSIMELEIQSLDLKWFSGILRLLAPFVEKNIHLRKLVLGSNRGLRILKCDLSALSTALRSRKEKNLQVICLPNLHLDYNMTGDVLSSLSGYAHFERLELPGITSVTSDPDVQTRAIFHRPLATLMQNSGSNLKTLCLSRSQIISAVAAALAGPLSSNRVLKKLDLSHNLIGDFGALSVVTALANNRTLNTLDLSGNPISYEGWEPFIGLLCNPSNINSTYQSNHTLQDLGSMHYYMHPDLELYLALNRKDVKCNGRQKILKHHFAGNNFSMDLFADMKEEVLVQFIACFSRSDDTEGAYGQSALFQFLRSSPYLLGHLSKAGTKKRVAPVEGMRKKRRY